MRKIRLQRDVFETCNKWRNWQDVPVDIKRTSYAVADFVPTIDLDEIYVQNT